MYYIYQRISTEKQSLIRQEGAIEDYCKANNIVVPEENIYSDIITGKTTKRDGYQQLKAKLQKNDILIMLDLDRLGRKWDIIKTEWKDLTDKGVYIIIVNCPLINVLPSNNGEVSVDKRLIQEMMFTLLCYVSQKEVEKVSERTKMALKAKRDADPNFKIGRPTTITPDTIALIHTMREQGCSYDKISEETGVSKGSISRILNKRGK